MKTGAAIDKQMQQVAGVVKALKAREAALTKAGCWRTNLHMRGRKMVALDPQAGSERKYTYIGTDAAKQQEARDKVDRYGKREMVRRSLGELESEYEDLQQEHDDLKDRLDRTVKDAQGLLKETAKALKPKKG